MQPQLGVVGQRFGYVVAQFLISRFFGIPLVYDSHEYFCGVPEIQGRWVKRVWLGIERFVFPRLQHIWTVNESIASLYEQDYGMRPQVFRNMSPCQIFRVDHAQNSDCLKG